MCIRDRLVRLRVPDAPKDVVPRKIALQIRGPGEVDEWLLAYAGEHRLQSGGLGRRINVTREHLGRLRIIALDRGVDAMRIHLRKGGDAIFVLLLPSESLVKIRSGGRRLYIGQYDIRGSANWPSHDAVAVAQTSDGRGWSGAAPPAAIAGLSYRYRIMRRPVGAPAYIVLADVEPAATGTYLDKTFAWEQKYEYRITTLTQVDSHGINTAVEGDDSQPVEVFTRDIYPPAQPAGLQAVFSSVGQKPFIDLTWAPNLESDLAGYNIFRRVGNAQFEKLNKQLVSGSSFRDDNVETGKKYIYSVSAVDLRGNESQRSAEASETVPGK